MRDAGICPSPTSRTARRFCFVPDGDYAAFVERAASPAPAGGVVTDRGGRVLGRHEGVHRFTIGQRKGLHLSSSEPLYVVDISAATQTVVVGDRAALERVDCLVENVNWIDGDTPASPVRAGVQIRHRHPAGAATITALPGGRAHVRFDHPERAVTPGQAAVFYDGDEVLGGGWIERADSQAP